MKRISALVAALWLWAAHPVPAGEKTVGFMLGQSVVARLPVTLVPYKLSFSVPAPAFIDSFDSLFSPDTRLWLEQNQSEGVLTSQILRRIGIIHLYNPATDNIELSIPPTLLRTSANPFKRVAAPPASDWALADSAGWGAPAAQPALTAPATPATQPNLANPKPEPITQVYRATKTREELYEEIFRKKAPALPERIDASLVIDGQAKGTLWIRFEKDRSRFHFPADPILDALRGRLEAKAMERLEGSLQDGKYLTIPILKDCGIFAELDAAAFRLTLSVPAQLLGLQLHELTGMAAETRAYKPLPPSRLSAFLNFRLMERFKYFENTGRSADSSLGASMAGSLNEELRQPLVSDLDGALNVAGVVLEGEGLYQERIDEHRNLFSRRNVRWVLDRPAQALRFSLGDLTFPTAGYQGFLPQGGIGLARDFSLKPGVTAYPVKDYEFFLDNPAEVKVYVNGNLVSVLQLEPGSHDLRGFPFANGESEVKIEITDITGRMQDFTFNWIQEPSLLARDIAEFTVNAGFPSRPETFGIRRDGPGSGFRPLFSGNRLGPVEYYGYEYDFSTPTGSFLYRRGITDLLTGGVYGEFAGATGLSGVELWRALPVGKLQFDLAATLGNDSSSGAAVKLDWSYLSRPKASEARMGWRSQVEYRSRGFRRDVFGIRDTRGPITISNSAQLPNPIFNVSASGDYTMQRHGKDTYGLSLGLGKVLARSISCAFSLRHTLESDGVPNTSVTANVSYALYVDKHGLIAGERLASHQNAGVQEQAPKSWDNYTDLRWDYNSSAPFPTNPSAMASASFGPANNEYTSRLGLRGDQGLAELYLRRSEPTAASNSPAHQNFADLSAEASLVFVDGAFGLSRPITNSFLLVKGVDSHAGNPMKINPQAAGYDASGNRYLPAVLPALAPYTPRAIMLDPGEPPLWSPPVKTYYTLSPTYKSAYALRIGSPPTALVMGVLVDAAGMAVKSRSFKLRRKGGTEEPALAFTNAQGRFQLPPVVPGDYEIILDEDRPPGILAIPPGTKGLFRIGSLRMPE
jgi:outer membrane usher protein